MVIALLVGWVLLGLVIAVGLGQAVRIADARAERPEPVAPLDLEVPTLA